MKTNSVLMLSVLAGVLAGVCAEPGEYSDQDIKRQIVFAGRCYHADDMDSNYEWAFRMSGYDTNRYARVLCELAGENTNHARRAIALLGVYKTPQSLPFLYSYATNAQYGAYAMKSIFAIEGITSNSLSAAESFLSITNSVTLKMDYDRSDICEELLRKMSTSPDLSPFRPMLLTAAITYAQNVSMMHKSLDEAICDADSTYRYSKRRLAVMRAAQDRCWNATLTNHVANAINELVAYPEANLPD